MITWIKQLREAVTDFAELKRSHAYLANVVTSQEVEIRTMREILKKHCEVSVDIGFKGECHIILLGRYKKQDYVQTYRFTEMDFGSVVGLLRTMSKYNTVKLIDAPPDVQGNIKRCL